MGLTDQYFLRLAAAFVRGKAILESGGDFSSTLLETPYSELKDTECEEIVKRGLSVGYQMHKFKQTMNLRRVQRVFGILHALAPSQLLDIGSGRGTFLWPLLDQFADLDVAAVDRDERRTRDLRYAVRGGINRLAVYDADVTELSFADDSFDVVTMLEVLEHIREAQSAVNEVVRVARRFVVLSVPSKEDDNPEHIQLLNEPQLRTLFQNAGVCRLNFDGVLGHIVLVANVTDDR